MIAVFNLHKHNHEYDHVNNHFWAIILKITLLLFFSRVHGVLLQ